ncbi:hypothetical protein CYMTET_42702 [Cymbomonas tetramitiformis]|uniref:Uncharacterized protein n=1 Tax=Cymbomonas tetramitiformis TaxID=36881 RepID=A0AAE0F2D9_9CHLO|nr:hypothetical protein CYMTET_42702 [Cymbomonas tetramitiformis]
MAFFACRIRCFRRDHFLTANAEHVSDAPAGGSGGSGGSGGGDDDESAGGGFPIPAEIAALLSTSGRTPESLPPLLASALASGALSADILKKYLLLEKAFLSKFFLRFNGFLERLLADPLFMTKVGIEVGVGICTKTAAELERRRGKFWQEFDFVVADVIMALIADFMLVWLPAPTIALRPCKVTGLQKFMCQLPDNAFQKVLLKGEHFSIAQRAAAVGVNGSKLLGVGLFSSFVGTGLTNGIRMIKKSVSGAAAEQTKEADSNEPPLLQTSLAYGSYMATSSNLRYQLMAGVFEQRMLEPLLHGNNALLSLSSFVLRTGNTFLGSLLWVDYARWIGVQPKDD